MSMEYPPARGSDAKATKIDPRDFNLWEPTYTVRETAKAISCGHTRLYELIANGELHPIKRGRQTIFLALDLANHLKRLQDAAPRYFRKRQQHEAEACDRR